MSVGFTVAARINRPVDDVYESVVSPDRLSKYFTTDGAKGRIEAGATVMWQFPEEPGEYPVDVIEAVAPERIVLQWDAPEGTSDGRTTATMTFESLDDGRTLVTIKESGWRDDEPGRTASYGNCEGWTQMLCCLKAWVEYDVVLRNGYYQ